MALFAQLAWPILERIRLPGGFAISPHGISIALGFLLGAQVMLRRAERRGVARRPVAGIPELVQTLMVRAAIGAILGARFFYVVTRLEQFPDPLSWFAVWEGGLSLLGGITGAVLAGLPVAYKRRLSVRLLLDSVAPGLALGIFIGRVGDLVIGEHLGGRTDFFLGWRCTGNIGIGPPQPFPGPRVQGCFDVAVHQTALYDFLAAGVVFAVLLAAERRPRFDGFFAAAFGILYGGFRFVDDFARAADKDLVGPLTGSQVASLAVIVAIVAWLVTARPWRTTPWAWSPPDFAHPWDGAQPVADAPDGSGDADEAAPAPAQPATGDRAGAAPTPERGD